MTIKIKITLHNINNALIYEKLFQIKYNKLCQIVTC